MGVEEDSAAAVEHAQGAVVAEEHARVLAGAGAGEEHVRPLVAAVVVAARDLAWAVAEEGEADQVPAVATSRITLLRSVIRQVVAPRDPISGRATLGLAVVIDRRLCRVTPVPVVAAPGAGFQA